ncbi:MAG: hypothetical protein M0Z82_09655 [Actinomycetota bacterium]|nr:hypothetical protein [Actinomycetota bacterium]MDA8358982.1 hypothetical protein [Actinomycetota bacterium]
MEAETTERIDGLLDELAVVLAEWRSATRDHDQAITHQARALATAEHRLCAVLGTLGLQRWRNLVSARAQVYTALDGLDMIRARRIRSEVEAAVADLAAVRADEAERVAVAWRRMGEVATRLVPYGPLVTDATGYSMAELRRLAAAVQKH